jgi:polyhydroxyalkanoate synthase
MSVPAPMGFNLMKSLDEMLVANRKLMSGIDTMLSITDVDVALTPKNLVYREDKVSLYHYEPKVEKISPVPTLIVYALVNRQYMMDLQQDKSVISRWLELGLDVYIIDWGYPDKMDKYLTLEDYVDGYIDNAVEVVRQRSGQDKINLLGVCQGGTFCVMYSALYPEKVKNLVTMVTPVDFSTEDGLLFIWSKHMNIDNLVDAFGVVPGSFMNTGFLMLKPFQLMLDKYMGLLENLDNPDMVREFLRMEKWIFDSPAQAGEAFRRFIKDLFQDNLLIQNKFELGGRIVNLKNITMPLLNVFAEQDHLVPPASSKPLNDAVASTDKGMISFPGGHIGIYVSSRSQKDVAPSVARWLNERSNVADTSPQHKGPGRKNARSK